MAIEEREIDECPIKGRKRRLAQIERVNLPTKILSIGEKNTKVDILSHTAIDSFSYDV